MNNLSPEQLRRAADIQEHIASLQAELGTVLGVSIGGGHSPGSNRKISANGLARIRAAQRKRWAKSRKHRSKKAPKPKLSAAGRAKLATAAKARWAAAKKAGRNAL